MMWWERQESNLLSRLFGYASRRHVRCPYPYLPTPTSVGSTCRVQFSRKKPDYLHRPSGVNDIILNWVVDGAGVEPTSLRQRASAVFQPSKLTAHVAEITRPAIGID